MKHPEDRLAEYVDGLLAPEHLPGLEEHLRACPACREGVAEARRGRDLVKRLSDVPAPLGLARRAVDAEVSEKASRRRVNQTTFRWLAAAAAAAAVFVGIVVMLAPGRRGDPPVPVAAGSPAQTELAREIAARDPKNLSGAELQALAEAERLRYMGKDPFENPSSSTPQGLEESATGEVEGSPNRPPMPAEKHQAEAFAGLRVRPAAGEPEECLEQSGGMEAGGRLLRIYEAEALGVPAYFGVLAQGPEPGAEPDRIVIWVADQKTCEVIGYSQAFLEPQSPAPAPPEFDFPTP